MESNSIMNKLPSSTSSDSSSLIYQLSTSDSNSYSSLDELFYRMIENDILTIEDIIIHFFMLHNDSRTLVDNVILALFNYTVLNCQEIHSVTTEYSSRGN